MNVNTAEVKIGLEDLALAPLTFLCRNYDTQRKNSSSTSFMDWQFVEVRTLRRPILQELQVKKGSRRVRPANTSKKPSQQSRSLLRFAKMSFPSNLGYSVS